MKDTLPTELTCRGDIFKLVLGSNQANQLKFNVYDGLMVTTCSEETYAIREVNLFGVGQSDLSLRSEITSSSVS